MAAGTAAAGTAATAIGVASALSPLISSGLNFWSNRENNQTNERLQRETNAQNKELFERQLAWEEDMWNKSNAYNDPSRQVERLAAAGINPAFVLGNGSMAEASSMSAPSAPQMQAPKHEAFHLDPSAISGALGSTAQLLMNYQMQRDKLDKDWIDTLKDADMDPETKNFIIKNKYFKSDKRTDMAWKMLQLGELEKQQSTALQTFELNMAQEKNDELRKQWNRNKERHDKEMRVLVREANRLFLDSELLKSQKTTEDKKIEIIDETLNRFRRINDLFSGEDISFRAVLEMIHDLFSGGLVGLIGALK